MADLGEDLLAEGGGDVVVLPFWGSNEYGWVQRDIDVYLQGEEHGGAVYNYLPHSVPMPVYG